MLVKCAAILTSYDIDKTEAFYTEKLGFQCQANYSNYLIVARDEIILHFSQLDMGNPATTMTQCYCYVSDVDALHAEYNEQGVLHPNGPLEDKPWGTRQFTILDDDGNALVFGQLLDG